ncbi:hypothetical protein MU580_11965 [Clavibacter michiganensis subsp. michiganensis]|uniref:hypothetical protein n=1 Tax=Clavibacter michiganensis TaxID=28447 RepID=UPI001FF38597|nr:hypothetical protein [Clavibacter michiganensis]UOW02983.1 hypothetical protein MU580_11965 [Clavibacter michiganensis subsp. michiganensis]
MKRVLEAGLNFLFAAWWLDYLLVAGAVIAAVKLVPDCSAFDILGQLPLDDRREAYSDLITIAALLAGFTSVAYTTYLGWQSSAIERLRARAGRRLQRIWIALIAAPWFATLLLWAVKVTDRGNNEPTNDVRWLALAGLALVIASVIRSVWVFLELFETHQVKKQPVQNTATEMPQVRSKAK